VIAVTGTRADALARLDVFVGEWVLRARFPGDQPAPASAGGNGPQVHSTFEWTLDRQFLVQRTEVPVPEAPDSLTIVSVDPQTGAYTQHYYDSRGVARLYGMTLEDGVWTLTRESPDFTPPGVPAALHRHFQRGREHHQRRLGEGRQGFRLGA
jgi:hypothetical protein